MSQMIEVYLEEGRKSLEPDVIKLVERTSGRLTDEENNDAERVASGTCLTFELDSIESANSAVELMIEKGFHVEGPYDY